MKDLNKIFVLGALCVGFCVFNVGNASAKVCFVGDENCVKDTGNFDGVYGDDADDTKNLCEAAGYKTSKDQCTEAQGKRVGEFCPYNHKYVICCEKEYYYDACPHNLKEVGRCGKKYKCVCDAETYPFTELACKTKNFLPTAKNVTPINRKLAGGPVAGSSGHIGGDDPISGDISNTLDGYSQSKAGGVTCQERDFSKEYNGEMVTKYSECICDRGIFPMSEDDPQCENAVTEGLCIARKKDKDGKINSTEYYKMCKCNTSIYKETYAGCLPFSPDTKDSCFDYTWHYKSCNNCDGYYDNCRMKYVPETVGGPMKESVKGCSSGDGDYYICPNLEDRAGSKKEYKKICRCNALGYKVNAAGNGCILKTCNEVLNEALAKPKIAAMVKETYALLKGDQNGNLYVVDFDGNRLSDEEIKHKQVVMMENISYTPKDCSSRTDTGATQKKLLCTQIGCINGNVTKDQCLMNVSGVYPGMEEKLARDESDCARDNLETCCTNAQYPETDEIVFSGKGLGCISGLNKVSSMAYHDAYFNVLWGEYYEPLVKACSVSAERPTLTVSGLAFPNNNSDSTNSSDITFEGIDLKFTAPPEGPINIESKLKVFDGNIEGNIAAQNDLRLERYAQRGIGEINSDNDEVEYTAPVLNAGYFSVGKNFWSTGYDIEFGMFYIQENRNKYAVQMLGDKDNRISITGGEFQVLGIASASYADINIGKLCLGTNCGDIRSHYIKPARYYYDEKDKNRREEYGVRFPSVAHRQGGISLEQKLRDARSSSSAFYLYDSDYHGGGLYMSSASLLGAPSEDGNVKIHVRGDTFSTISLVYFVNDDEDIREEYSKVPYLPANESEPKLYEFDDEYFVSTCRDRSKYENTTARCYLFLDSGSIKGMQTAFYYRDPKLGPVIYTDRLSPYRSEYDYQQCSWGGNGFKIDDADSYIIFDGDSEKYRNLPDYVK